MKTLHEDFLKDYRIISFSYMYPFKVSACQHISTTDKLANNLSEYKLLLVYNTISMAKYNVEYFLRILYSKLLM